MSEQGGPHESSVEHAVAGEHRKLDSLFTEMRAALRTDQRAAGEKALSRLCETLETHFAQEDHLYFPAIWSLRPEYKAPLLAFIEAHERFRGILSQITAHLEGESMQEVERALEEFAEAFANHEMQEEELLRSLDRELARGHS